MDTKIRDFKHCFELLDQVVKGREDYKYQTHSGRCFYTDGVSECDCIVGHVLKAAGFPFDQISALDHGSSYSEPIGFRWSQLSDYSAGEPFMDLPRSVIDLLSFVQELQDEGIAWGAVVVAAKEMLGGMTGRQFIQKILESNANLDDEIVFSHESYARAEMITSGEIAMDNYYGIESIAHWTHPEDGEYARIILK